LSMMGDTLLKNSQISPSILASSLHHLTIAQMHGMIIHTSYTNEV